MERPVVLCGLGQVGWRVLESVRAAGLPVVAVDLNTAPDDPRLRGVRSVKGDCRRAEVLEEAGIRDAGAVVIVTSDDLVNVSTALLVRKLNPTARIVVRMFNQNLLDRLGGAVKNTVALSVSGLTAPLLALTAVTGDALGAFQLDDGPRQVSELVVARDSSLAGKTHRRDVAREHRLIPLAFTPADGGRPGSCSMCPPTRRSPPATGSWCAARRWTCSSSWNASAANSCRAFAGRDGSAAGSARPGARCSKSICR